MSKQPPRAPLTDTVTELAVALDRRLQRRLLPGELIDEVTLLGVALVHLRPGREIEVAGEAERTLVLGDRLAVSTSGRRLARCHARVTEQSRTVVGRLGVVGAPRGIHVRASVLD